MTDPRSTTDGEPPTDDRWDSSAPKPKDADGQHAAYWVLPDEDRARGFVRPLRDTYVHLTCGKATTLGPKIAETFAAKPDYYTSTFCVACREHFPVGDQEDDGEFVWQVPGKGIPLGTQDYVGT